MYIPLLGQMMDLLPPAQHQGCPLLDWTCLPPPGSPLPGCPPSPSSSSSCVSPPVAVSSGCVGKENNTNQTSIYYRDSLDNHILIIMCCSLTTGVGATFLIKNLVGYSIYSLYLLLVCSCYEGGLPSLLSLLSLLCLLSLLSLLCLGLGGG